MCENKTMEFSPSSIDTFKVEPSFRFYTVSMSGRWLAGDSEVYLKAGEILELHNLDGKTTTMRYLGAGEND